MRSLPAAWFDGQSAQAQDVELAWDQGELLLRTAEGSTRRYARGQVVWPERTRHGQRQLLLPDGGVVSLADAKAWDDWAAGVGLAQPLAARWALNWPLVGLAMVLLIATLLGAWRWGIPWAAQRAADLVPQQIGVSIGRRVMQDITQRGWIRDSQLPAATQQRIRDATTAMVAMAYAGQPLPRYELHLRKGPKWLGPNAFALPGGDIVVTDALVELLQHDSASVSPALLGVIAHELGHVREQHGLRMVFEAGAISVLMGWWIGDYSSVLAAAPALMAQSAYSRGHERSADAEALRVMRAAGIDPRAMVLFFTKLKEELPEHHGDNPVFGLATHPADSERVRFFESN